MNFGFEGVASPAVRHGSLRHVRTPDDSLARPMAQDYCWRRPTEGGSGQAALQRNSTTSRRLASVWLGRSKDSVVPESPNVGSRVPHQQSPWRPRRLRWPRRGPGRCGGWRGGFVLVAGRGADGGGAAGEPELTVPLRFVPFTGYVVEAFGVAAVVLGLELSATASRKVAPGL